MNKHAKAIKSLLDNALVISFQRGTIMEKLHHDEKSYVETMVQLKKLTKKQKAIENGIHKLLRRNSCITY